MRTATARFPSAQSANKGSLVSFRRLSGLDAAFLHAETARTPMHVMGAIVFESHGRPGEDFRRTRAQIARRLPALPILRRKLHEVPLGLAHPVWIDDRDFDLDAHVRRAALPAPAGERELADLLARIAEVPLHRDRPLWEMHVVEGLARKRVALVAKIHHAVASAIDAAQLLGGLLDAEPRADDPHGALPDPDPAEPAPSALALLADAALDAGGRPLRGALALWRATGAGARLLASSFSSEFPLPSAPRTRLGGRVSGRRAVALGSVALSDVTRAKSAFAATVNHVVLAACAGALRRHFEAHGDAPRQPLVAAVPMALGDRAPDSARGALSMLLVRLPVHLADPLARLHAARDASRAAMRAHELLGGAAIGEWADAVTPALLAGASRVYARFGLAEHHPPFANVVISNLPVAPTPLYCAGARVTACHAIGAIYDGCALHLSAMRYDGRLAFGAIACRDAVPDPSAIARGFEASVAELCQLADGRAEPVAAAG